uniref:Orphan peptide AbOp-6 n=1 Tax=Androctonus bicolor TaxID=748906 RepID=A0A0K0LC31_9SCOR|nr:orphan peptide AbOp-6 [Androctonus bicolor]
MKLIFYFLILAMIAWFEGVRCCTSPSDCGEGECCRIGRERYSTPRCEKYGPVGDHCIRSNQPEDKVLAYPNNEILEVKGVYTLFCPCERDLQCSRGICQ